MTAQSSDATSTMAPGGSYTQPFPSLVLGEWRERQLLRFLADLLTRGAAAMGVANPTRQAGR